MAEEGAAELRAERPAMGMTHEDFFRVFPSLLSAANWHREGLSIHVEWPDGATMVATVSCQKQRKIASLSLPYVDIDFGFRAMTDDQRDAFLLRFDRAFQKGGG